MKSPRLQLLLALLALALPLPGAAEEAAPAGKALSADEMKALLTTIDDRQRNSGDYHATAYIEQKERGKSDLVYLSSIYRRDSDDKLLILFLRPKAEAGKGYLRLDKNLFFYDPTVGKWERRTERERIGGTNSNRSDFDERRLVDEYTPTYVGKDKLGNFSAHHLTLTAKKGVDVAYPVLELWIDVETGNILKQQERALSGRLMRTSYYPKWGKIFSESKGEEIYFPREIRIFDEVEAGRQTTIKIPKVDLKPLEDNIFTKAWLESKSR